MQISEEGGTHFGNRGPPSGQYPKVYIQKTPRLRPSNPTTLISEFRITLQPVCDNAATHFPMLLMKVQELEGVFLRHVRVLD